MASPVADTPPAAFIKLTPKEHALPILLLKTKGFNKYEDRRRMKEKQAMKPASSTLPVEAHNSQLA